MVNQDPNQSVKSEATNLDNVASESSGADADLVAGLDAREWAFDIEDRGFRVRGSYQDELGDNIEVFRGGRLFKSFTYPGYRIWNIAAHFHDYVIEQRAKDDAVWRELDALASTQVAESGASSANTQ